jgi:hypothetical protein
MMVVAIMWYNSMSTSGGNYENSSSEEEDDNTKDRSSVKRRHSGNPSTKDSQRAKNKEGYSKKKAASSITPSHKQVRQGGGTANKGSRVPGLHVASSTSVSSMSQVGMTMPIVEHYSESSAVREFVRGVIYPKKKTIFCNDELVFGSQLSKLVVNYMLYANEGFYRRKKEAAYSARQQVEVSFWTRNQETVRRVLREKLNNSISRFRYKMGSK